MARLIILCLLSVPLFAEAKFFEGSSEEAKINMPHEEVKYWATKIGQHISSLANAASQYKDISDAFDPRLNKDVGLMEQDGIALVKEMAKDVSNMMSFKIQAVKRIMNVAEEASLGNDRRFDSVDYYNSKKLNRRGADGELLVGFKELMLMENSHFDGYPVNLSLSSVHVPTNVYDRGEDVLDAIAWSQKLEPTFISNYMIDPTLTWQYFGSSSGFLRQYPAASWILDATDPDLYDSRLRSWYIQAANSPKDMVILLDVSGSMTGLRREIAKHVVINILDTLTENDFVNVYNFSDQTHEVVPCFNNSLVQANLENVGEFKLALNNMRTENIANFSQALTIAFELLASYMENGRGSHCNQAIMLITDGAPYNYFEIISKYNKPAVQVRIFTYLIGREVTDKRHLKWMACSNKGYFAHVTTLAEVREQVLKYVPVVARPLVMMEDVHPHVWTGVYADIADPKQTEWLWELRERHRQKERTQNYKTLKKWVYEDNPEKKQDLDMLAKNPSEVEKFLHYGKLRLTERDIAKIATEDVKKSRPYADPIYRRSRKAKEEGRRRSQGLRDGYRLVTTVSVPVFDRKNSSHRTANLLGVAGADVPITEIQKLVPPYKLGVNGYSFIVNNNGYILYHPDLRPVHEEANAEVERKSRDKRTWFQDILKPNYNSVDLAEVELIHDHDTPRINDSELQQLRRDMIEQVERETTLKVKIHLDNMKRVTVRTNRYSTQKIADTPFSLGIALPETYSKYRVNAQVEVSRVIDVNSRSENVSQYFTGNWHVHPDWVYCEYKYDQREAGSYYEKTPEELLIEFLDKAQSPGWKWRSTRTQQPEDTRTASVNRGRQSVSDEERRKSYYCDKELVQSLIFDAKATNVYNKKPDLNNYGEQGTHKRIGITTAFVATRSGLTRWVDKSESHSDEPHFMELHNKAIDEVWYKRAVDYYNEDPDAYVYSVPFDASTQDPNEVMVTATRAVFVEPNRYKRAPAAVVGVTIALSNFTNYFLNETFQCPQFKATANCVTHCGSPYHDCYLLDDNGFTLASENENHAGKFFGEIEGTIMESLVQSEVYNRIKIFDYQSVCLDVMPKGSYASILDTPIQMFKWTIKWLLGKFLWVMVKTQLYYMWDPNMAWAYSQEEETVFSDLEVPITPPAYGNMEPPPTEKPPPPDPEQHGEFPKLTTHPRPCDKEVNLYKLNNSKLKTNQKYEPVKGKLSNCNSDGCGRPFIVQKVIHTNLVFVVVHNLCSCESRTVDTTPREVKYNDTAHCERLLLRHFRKRPESCYSYHSEEDQIKLCGGTSYLTPPSITFLVLLVSFLFHIQS